MNIGLIEDPAKLTPKQTRIDYDKIAERYNSAQPGRGIEIPKVSNITNFKKALERRGLKEGEDFKAWHDGNVCKVQRLTLKTMN